MDALAIADIADAGGRPQPSCEKVPDLPPIPGVTPEVNRSYTTTVSASIAAGVGSGVRGGDDFVVGEGTLRLHFTPEYDCRFDLYLSAILHSRGEAALTTQALYTLAAGEHGMVALSAGAQGTTRARPFPGLATSPQVSGRVVVLTPNLFQPVSALMTRVFPSFPRLDVRARGYAGGATSLYGRVGPGNDWVPETGVTIGLNVLHLPFTVQCAIETSGTPAVDWAPTRRSATLAYRLSGHWLTVRWLGVDAAPKPYAEYSVGLAFLHL